MNGTDAQAPAPLPRWFLLLPLLALVAWWPISPMWQSDDFVAVNYARDFGNVLHDFVGPQYGAQDLWFFYRPLITLSFWCDGLVGGADPWFAHFSNTLAHAVNTLLVGLIWLRFVSPLAAFAVGALWCLQPAHSGAVLWAVGRVDSHTTVWCLLSVWLLLRHLEGSSGARWLSLGAFALALGSKELAFAVPFLLLGVAMVRGQGDFRSRLRLAIRTCAPHLWLLLAYFVFRRIVLGVFVGGYAAATFDPVAMVTGLGRIVLHLLNPLLWTAGSPGTELLDGAPRFLVWIGFLPALLALAVLLHRRRFRALLWGLLLFLVASLPTAPFWMDPANVHNLRYFYFPCAALAGLCAGAGRAPALLVLMVQLPALVAIRADYVAADRQSGVMFSALQRVAPINPYPLFVAGMPHTNRRGTVIQFHFGVDRMFAEPFAAPHIISGTANRMFTARRKLYALRPFAELPAVFTLGDDGQPFALPWHATATFVEGELVPVAQSSKTELPLEVLQGPDEAHLEATQDLDLRRDGLQKLKDNKLVIRIRTPGVKPEAYRITFFTATGYLCSVVGNRGATDATEGHVDLRYFLKWACCARAPIYMMRALEIPAIHDLDTDFPVLVEAGSAKDGVFDEQGRLAKGEFVASHRASKLLTFRCDRGWPALVRAILNE